MEKLGIDTSKLIVSGSKILEDIFEKTIYFVKCFNDKKVEVPLTIVIDSISQASSRAEIEDGFDKSDMKRAQVIRKGLRMVSGLISDHKVCLIIVNHQTTAIGNTWGPPKVTSGGTAIEYFPSQIIEVNKGKAIKNELEIPIGMEIRVKIMKSRFYVPFITARVEVYFGKGLDPFSGLFEILCNAEIIKKVSQAGWYAFREDVEKKYRESEIKDIVFKNVDTYLKMIESDQVIVAGIEGE
jgi:recombination protein RecA